MHTASRRQSKNSICHTIECADMPRKTFVGKPCRFGHRVRYKLRHQCVACTIAYAAKWARQNPEKRREQGQAQHRKARYGVSRETFRRMLVSSAGVCAICRQLCVSGHALSIDHNHQCCSGEKSCGQCLRGLLCKACNRLLGDSRERIEVLQAAIRYLRQWSR